MLTTEVSALYLPKWEDLVLEKYVANPFKVGHVDESDRASMWDLENFLFTYLSVQDQSTGLALDILEVEAS